MTSDEHELLDRADKLSVVVRDRVLVLKAYATRQPLLNSDQTDALLKDATKLVCAVNGLNCHANGNPPPKLAP